MLIGHLAVPIQEGVNAKKMTAVPISNQSTIAQRSPTMTMNSAITDLCGRCGKMNHTDKMLVDQCRLMTAMLGPGWGKVEKAYNNNNDGEKTCRGQDTMDTEATQVGTREIKEHEGLSTNPLDILTRAV